MTTHVIWYCPKGLTGDFEYDSEFDGTVEEADQEEIRLNDTAKAPACYKLELFDINNFDVFA